MIMKNQLLNLKMIALMCLMMVLGGANVWAEQYKIVFVHGESENNAKMSNSTKKSEVISSGVEYVARFETCSYVYNKCTKGLKLGNTKNAGTFEFSIADGYQKNIKKITVKSSEYSSTDNAKLSLFNGTTSLKSEIPGTDLVYTFANPTTVSSIKISTSKANGKSKPRAYISEIILETAEANNPTLVASESALDFGAVENNTSKDLTFKLSGSKLTADATLSVAGDYFTVTPTSVPQTDGTIVETEVTVSYNPTAVGSHAATLTISSTGAEAKTITLTGTSANAYAVAWNVNGNVYTDGTPTTKVVDGEKVTVLPTTPENINGKAFVGWTATEISGESASKPTDLFATVENAPVVSANTTYYAVYANKVGTESWKKVTAANVNSEGEGEYALLTPDGHAFNGKFNSSGQGLSTADVFIFVDDKAETVPEGTCVLTLTKTGTNGYKMYNAESGYLSVFLDGTKRKLVWQTAENSYWSYSTSNWVYKAKNYYLRTYNKTFRLYEANNNDELLFAKKVSDIAYSGYCTTVAAEPVQPTSVTIDFKAHDSDGFHYATFSSDKDVVFNQKSVDVFAVSVSNEKVDMNILADASYKVTDATVGSIEKGYYVPANTGVLIVGYDATTTYYFPAEAQTVTLPANQLKPAPANGGVFEATADYKYYKLAYDNYDTQEGLGFYWGAPEGGKFFVKAGTAYLAVRAGEATAKGFTLNGEATGIEGVNANVENAKAIYNLNGQRVASMAKPGLYIVNGKKVVRK